MYYQLKSAIPKLLNIPIICLFSMVYYIGNAQTNKPIADMPSPLQGLQNEFYENYTNPKVAIDSAKIYTMTDTSSIILKKLAIGTSVEILREGRIGKSNTNWYMIRYQNLIGYMLASTIATHSYSGKKDIVYLVLDEFSITDFPSLQGKMGILKFNIKLHKILDTITINKVGQACLVFSLHDGCKLKNVDGLFRIKFMATECPGYVEDHFIVDANGHLSKFISTSTYGEELSANEVSSDVYLPVVFHSGKVLLVENGDIDHIFDSWTGNLNTYKIPKDLNIQPSQLVVYTIKEYVSILDKNKEPIPKKDGSYRFRYKQNDVIYYGWNGEKLIKLKTKSLK